MASHVVKVTMIKVPLEDMDAAIEKCQNFIKNHQKDGAPYILSAELGRVSGRMRDEGYTLVAKNVFKNAEDMKYFDEDDPEHNELKKFIHGKATGMTNCVFTPEVSVNL